MYPPSWAFRLKSFDMEPVSNEFSVILYPVENNEKLSSNLSGMDLNERRKLSQFIIANVIEELVGHRYHAGYVAEVDDMRVGLVNLCGNDAAELKGDLSWIASEAQRFLLRFHMDLTISIGGIHWSLFGVAQAYREALDAMEYRMVRGKREIIRYDEIRMDSASSSMSEMLEQNLNKLLVLLTLARCLIFNLVGTMVKVINKLGDGDSRLLGDNPLWMDSIIACDTILECSRSCFLCSK